MSLILDFFSKTITCLYCDTAIDISSCTFIIILCFIKIILFSFRQTHFDCLILFIKI